MKVILVLLVVYTLYAGRAVTDVRSCSPTHLLIFDFTRMSNKICLNQFRINLETFSNNNVVRGRLKETITLHVFEVYNSDKNNRNT